ncbi:MAG: hypothetical protein ACRD0A_06935 [Acidimicrobiales bacterium]
MTLAGCNGNETDGASQTTQVDETTTEAPTTTQATTTTLTREDEVLAAYRAANQALVAAANPPNADHPLLAAHLTGRQLDVVRSVLRQQQANNIGQVANPESHPRDVVVSGASARLTDCFIDRTQTIDLASGAPVGDPGETVLHLDVVMEHVQGSWKLAQLQQRSDSCDPSSG